MNMTQRMHDGLNNQINAEFWSAYQYLSMSTYLADKGYMGMAHWMMVQYQEELAHMHLIINYLISRGKRVALKAIDTVPTEWESPLAVFEVSIEHERAVSGMFHALMTMAVEDKDYAAQSMLTGFINEQVEEESNFTQQVMNLRMAQTHTAAMLMLDKQMGERVLAN